MRPWEGLPMWGGNKLLTALAVGLCFVAGLVRNQGALLLLSIAVALGAYRLEHYLNAHKERELLSQLYAEDRASRHHDALVQAGIIHEAPAAPRSLGDPLERTSY